MIQAIEYQGDGFVGDKPVMLLSKDIGGLTLIGHFVRTDTITVIEQEEENNEPT